MLTREEWTRGPGAPPVVKGLVWFTGGSRTKGGTGAGVYGQYVGRRLSVSVGRYAAVFQAEIYAVLACAYEIQLYGRSEKYVSICCDSQVALEALQAARTTSSLVQQCQKVLNDISTRHTVGQFRSLDMLGCEKKKSPTSSQEMVLFRNMLELSRP